MALRVIAQQWTSLDGYASGPNGEQVIFDAASKAADAASQDYNARLRPDVDEVLLGRTSYESFVQFWPSAVAHEVPIAPLVNAIPKVVFSRTLEHAEWGDFESPRIERDALAYVRGRSSEPSTVLVWGSVDVVHQLLEAELIDEFDLFVAPVLLGAGTRLVPDGSSSALELISCNELFGVVHVRYRRCR